MKMQTNLSIAVLISGNGSNLQAILNAIQYDHLPIRINAVISNNPNAYGLERAKKAHIPTYVLSQQEFTSRDHYDAALSTCLANCSPDLIVLAGFMRILGKSIIYKFENRIINIHPSLLPKYPGLNTHLQVIENQDSEHGCSIHFVDEHLDAGPLIAQVSLKVSKADNVATLKQKVHQAEYFLYPTVLNWFANKRIDISNSHVFLDKILIPTTGLKFLMTEN